MFVAASYLKWWLWMTHVPPDSEAPKQKFDDSVTASLDIFPQTIAKQRVNFRWIAVDEVNVHLFGIRIMTHVQWTLSVSKIRKPLLPTLRARIQRHLSISVHDFLYSYESSRCSLPAIQVCTCIRWHPVHKLVKASISAWKT